MSNIPAFHTGARKEAEARATALREERQRAESFLEELDDVLGDLIAPSSSTK